MDQVDYKEASNNIIKRYLDIKNCLDIESIELKIKKLEKLTYEQDFWDNNKNAEESFRRVAEAFAGSRQSEQTDEEERDKTEATLTWSPGESLSEKDFEKMSAEEVKEAITVIKTLRLPNMEVPTRRFSNRQTGKTMDMRRTIRQSLKFSGGFIPIIYKTRKTRRPPLVVICDISGSMERYSRMLLHFMHAVTNDRDRVLNFLDALSISLLMARKLRPNSSKR